VDKYGNHTVVKSLNFMLTSGNRKSISKCI